MTIPRVDSGQPLPDNLRGSVIALGNFDGFHLGHQAVVGEAIAWAKSEGRPAIIATFDPHPVRYFVPDGPPFRLTSIEQRRDLFEVAGADAILVFRFDTQFAETSDVDFVRVLLGEWIGAGGVVTGEDFSFGKGRRGSVATLRELGLEYGIEARAVHAVNRDGQIISSTRIREALRAGDCETATRLMTRPFAVRAPVQHGDKIGREIGYPTANLSMRGYLRPRYGIYAITGRLPDGTHLKGAANFGIRPSFDPPKELLEPYFFDWSGDLYGQEIEVAFHHFLRPEAKFDSLDELTAQMARDCDRARELLA